MIRKNELFCKLIRIKYSSKSLFDSSMAHFRPELEVCPCCHSKGNCRLHASYSRNLIDFLLGKTVYSNVVITRVICHSCHSTHAILPDFIIPYAGYSLFFILRVLAEYFAKLHTVDKLCSRFSISSSMLYRWLHLFLSHKKLWLGLLVSSSTTSFSFLKQLSHMNSFSSFSSAFVQMTSFSFLQLHANPTAFLRRYQI